MTLRPLIRAFTVPALALALGAIAAPPAAAEEIRHSVNINQASASELARLPRVGPKLADRIIAHRTQHGPFKRAEDLMGVKGVGEKMFATLKPYVAVSGPTTLTSKVSKVSSSRSRGASGKKKESASPRASGK